MNQIEIIASKDIYGRIVQVYGSIEDPLFLAKDIAGWLDITNTAQMVAPLDEDEKGIYNIDTLGGAQDVLIITEDGLYEVLMQSRKPIAKQWKKGVKQMLKELRKHGFTATPATLEEMIANPDLVIGLAERVIKERVEKDKALETVDELNEKIEVNEPKVIFADSVTGSKNAILVRKYAKDLCDDNFNIGQNRLFQWFRYNKYLNHINEPYQEYVDQGLFEVITRTIGSGEGTFTIKTTKITGKGQTYFAKKIKPLNKEGYKS